MAELQRTLIDRLVVVTGAFGHAGGAVAWAAKAAGARVAVIGHGDPPPGLDFDHVEARVDLTDSGQARAALDAIAARLGPIDALLNIAGGFEMQKLEAGTDVWDRMFAMNVTTTLNATAAALPRLRAPGGSVVNIAAAAAGRAGPGMGPYAAAKAAVLRLTESLAEEQKSRGVRVNAVSPTTLDTPDNRAAMPKSDPAKWVKLEELAGVMLFLASDAASGVTGADVRIAGRT
jgi:NAD(P)-dependent dehydrogenase (short-subunit alcohol dehydrogenase family)